MLGMVEPEHQGLHHYLFSFQGYPVVVAEDSFKGDVLLTLQHVAQLHS